MKTQFELPEVESWIEAARKAAQLPGVGTRRWSISPVDPTGMVAAFPPLRVKRGLVLRAYQLWSRGNGNGFVYALPETAAFPPPYECMREVEPLTRRPVPPEALASPMEAIEGDGSAKMYLAASMLAREFAEFGAWRLGVRWGEFEILDADPFLKKPHNMREVFFLEEKWYHDPHWLEEIGWPTEWPPTVEVGEEEVKVAFHTCLAGGDWAIFQHTDRYRPGTCVPMIERRLVAEGPEGYLIMDEKTGKLVFGANLQPLRNTV